MTSYAIRGRDGGTLDGKGAAQQLADRGDKFFLAGCLICGTWVLGPVGLPVLAYGVWMMVQAERAGAHVRPWAITIVGGLMLIDASVNYLAWGVDHYWAHDTNIGRTLFVGYGSFGDGGYAAFYNTTNIGGTAVAGEKAVQFSFIYFVMPMKIVAAWGLLKMRRYGLQWSIVSNWLYLVGWSAYVIIFCMEFDRRFGVSEFGVLGFWIMDGIPFLGPVVILPYLHTVNREMWNR